MSKGFQEEGYEIATSYDSWGAAIETHKANFDHPIQEDPITIDTKLPYADVIVGGPPCQGFSSAGLKKTGDVRNSLVSVFSNLVVKNRPKAFVFENVEGFLTSEKGQHVFALLQPLIEAGYNIHLRKINASNYGVPQHRKRVIAIGGRDFLPKFPEPTHSSRGAPGASLLNKIGMPPAPSVLEAIQDLPDSIPFSKDIFPEISDHCHHSFSQLDQQRASLLKQGQRMRDLPEKYWHKGYAVRANRRVSDGTPSEKRGGAPSGLRRLTGGEPSKAITGGALREFVHPLIDRPLTIRECARLQTFPDSFIFCGNRSDKIQLIGNAVPVTLARVIGSTLKKDLANPTSVEKSGNLISFIPTFSKIMSPALKRVSAQIESEFMPLRRVEQQSLCL